jgi:hypothetical protein
VLLATWVLPPEGIVFWKSAGLRDALAHPDSGTGLAKDVSAVT